MERQQPDEADSGTIAHARATNQFAPAIVARDGAERAAANSLSAFKDKYGIKTPRLKRTRRAKAKKLDLAVKYREQGKASGGGRGGVKKGRHALEARNLPVQRAPRNPAAGKKQRPGRHRAT